MARESSEFCNSSIKELFVHMDDLLIKEDETDLNEDVLMELCSLPVAVKMLLLKQYKTCRSEGFRVSLINNDLSIWRVFLDRKQLNPESRLYADLVLSGYPFIELEVTYEDGYPYIPPLYRVISPCLIADGLLTEDGIICDDAVTCEWNVVMQPGQVFQLLAVCLSKCKLSIKLVDECIKTEVNVEVPKAHEVGGSWYKDNTGKWRCYQFNTEKQTDLNSNKWEKVDLDQVNWQWWRKGSVMAC